MRIPMWAISKEKINFFDLLAAEKLIFRGARNLNSGEDKGCGIHEAGYSMP
jgi:hypothetical protein